MLIIPLFQELELVSVLSITPVLDLVSVPVPDGISISTSLSSSLSSRAGASFSLW